MNYRAGVITGAVGMLLLVGAAALAWRLVGSPPAGAKSGKPEPPARVSRLAKEDDFATITLTEKAEKRLGLQTAVVERKRVPRVRVLGGEVVVPPGGSLIVSAPLAGTLEAPEGGMPAAGGTVKKDQVVLQLRPLITPEGRATLAAARVEADGQVKSARTQVEAARVALTRARRLLSEQAGSRRNVDEAQAQFDLASRALEAARARRDLLARVVGDLEKGTVAPLPVLAPEGGMLRNISARPGQSVPSGASLFEVLNSRQMWVRLGVYVGELSELAVDVPVQVGNLADPPGRPTRLARPVKAPPSANPLAATVDLYYELDNADGRLRPGQRVAVHVPRQDVEPSLVVPWSAVVHDIHGGTWVYENPSPHVYSRRRVVVRHVSGPLAVLAAGPPPGTKVVKVGAAELFGTEVGFAK